ncbi:MAG: hypothetical protein A2542_00355 [Parcubacteria group bacterium RIFOXYD2_FULL_52_8]|nr:MAG: hypothetical protein A2542_00355 [Parcubacteria group bacterium RIFOXYD2_FULL_52_8]
MIYRSLFVLLVLSLVSVARAEVMYPIPELGGCADQEACAVYCDAPEHQDACTAYGVANNLYVVIETPPGGLSTDDQKRTDAIATFGGPDGACDDSASCRIYCDDPANELSCTQYSLEHDLLPRAQAEETIEVLTVPGPQGCTGTACEEYCALPGNEVECIEFAKSKGLIDPSEAKEQLTLIDEAKKPRQRMQQKPGACKGADCVSYCGHAPNMLECEQYALENGITIDTIGTYQEDVDSLSEKVIVPPASDELVPEAGAESEPAPTSGASLGKALSAFTRYLFSR